MAREYYVVFIGAGQNGLEIGASQQSTLDKYAPIITRNSVWMCNLGPRLRARTTAADECGIEKR